MSRLPLPFVTGSSGAAGSRDTLLRRLPGVAGAGVAAWLVDVTVLWVGHTVFGLAAWSAAAVGFVASGVVNYSLNRMVFRGRRAPSGGGLRRYAVLFAANLVVVSTAVPLLADGLHAAAPAIPAALIAAKIAVTAPLLPVNAVIYGAWVFPDADLPEPVSGHLGDMPPPLPGGPPMLDRRI